MLASPETELWEMPVFEIRDQHILVTGGSSGFGRHFAHFLANNGAKVSLAARRAEAWHPLLPNQCIRRQGAKRACSMSRVADKIDGAMKQAEAAFGPIHAVVNNAGVTATRPALDQDERSWDSEAH